MEAALPPGNMVDSLNWSGNDFNRDSSSFTATYWIQVNTFRCLYLFSKSSKIQTRLHFCLLPECRCPPPSRPCSTSARRGRRTPWRAPAAPAGTGSTGCAASTGPSRWSVRVWGECGVRADLKWSNRIHTGKGPSIKDVCRIFGNLY